MRKHADRRRDKIEKKPARPPWRLKAKALKLVTSAAILFSVSAFAQPQATPQSTGVNPPAGQAAIFHRAMTMYDAKNYGPALRAFEESADAGNVEAMMYLGLMYSEGQGAPVNFDEAVTWFHKAAAAGDTQGMCNLGNLYQKGLGVPVDYLDAAKWYRSAANMGNRAAMFNLGVLYEGGLGVPVDAEEARRWYAKSAEAPEPQAPATPAR